MVELSRLRLCHSVQISVSTTSEAMLVVVWILLCLDTSFLGYERFDDAIMLLVE